MLVWNIKILNSMKLDGLPKVRNFNFPHFSRKWKFDIELILLRRGGGKKIEIIIGWSTLKGKGWEI